jgi:hypothetical protein
MVFVPTERTIGGMPSFVGLESVADLLKKGKKDADPQGT